MHQVDLPYTTCPFVLEHCCSHKFRSKHFLFIGTERSFIDSEFCSTPFQSDDSA